MASRNFLALKRSFLLLCSLTSASLPLMRKSIDASTSDSTFLKASKNGRYLIEYNKYINLELGGGFTNIWRLRSRNFGVKAIIIIFLNNVHEMVEEPEISSGDD